MTNETRERHLEQGGGGRCGNGKEVMARNADEKGRRRDFKSLLRDAIVSEVSVTLPDLLLDNLSSAAARRFGLDVIDDFDQMFDPEVRAALDALVGSDDEEGWGRLLNELVDLPNYISAAGAMYLKSVGVDRRVLEVIFG